MLIQDFCQLKNETHLYFREDFSNRDSFLHACMRRIRKLISNQTYICVILPVVLDWRYISSLKINLTIYILPIFYVGCCLKCALFERIGTDILTQSINKPEPDF